MLQRNNQCTQHAREETDDVDTLPPIHPSLIRELTTEDISKLLKQCTDFKPIIDYICLEELPNNAREARTITAQAQSYVMTDDDVPNELREDVIAS